MALVRFLVEGQAELGVLTVRFEIQLLQHEKSNLIGTNLPTFRPICHSIKIA
jgi:hypothetical protein